MTENDELLVARFLARNTRDVPDDGFSDGVMRRLPVRSRPLYRIWTALCALLGVAFVVWARLWEGVGELFAGIAAHLRIEFDLGLSRVCDFLFSSHSPPCHCIPSSSPSSAPASFLWPSHGWRDKELKETPQATDPQPPKGGFAIQLFAGM